LRVLLSRVKCGHASARKREKALNGQFIEEEE
jgi:hypothetical protein